MLQPNLRAISNKPLIRDGCHKSTLSDSKEQNKSHSIEFPRAIWKTASAVIINNFETLI